MRSAYGEQELQYVENGNQYLEGFDAFSENSTEDKSELYLAEKWLLRHFDNWPSVRVISIGCSSGRWEEQLLKAMARSCNVEEIHFTAVEPHQGSLEAFQERVHDAGGGCKIPRVVSSEWLNCTWDGLASGKCASKQIAFDLVLFVQSMYYVDTRQVVPHVMAKLLSPNGRLAMFSVTDAAFYTQVQRRFTSLEYNTNLATSDAIKAICDEMQLASQHHFAAFIYNVTDLLNPKSKSGRNQFEFLFHADYDVIDENVKSDVKEFVDEFRQSNTCSSSGAANEDAVKRFKEYVISHVGMVMLPYQATKL